MRYVREISDDVERPDKWLDGKKLGRWVEENYPEIENEWMELTLDAFEWWIDFWDWLSIEYPELLDKFVKEVKNEIRSSSASAG